MEVASLEEFDFKYDLLISKSCDNVSSGNAVLCALFFYDWRDVYK